jgi:hypothetical protein
MPIDATMPAGATQRQSNGKMWTPAAAPHDYESPAAFLINNQTILGTAQFERMVKTAVVPLAAVDTGGGIFSWANPEVGSILITRVLIDVTTIATGACSIDIGTATASGTTSADTLIDGLDVHTATGTFDQADQVGANGKTKGKIAAGKWVTASKDTGASAGLVGNAYIQYVLV